MKRTIHNHGAGWRPCPRRGTGDGCRVRVVGFRDIRRVWECFYCRRMVVS